MNPTNSNPNQNAGYQTPFSLPTNLNLNIPNLPNGLSIQQLQSLIAQQHLQQQQQQQGQGGNGGGNGGGGGQNGMGNGGGGMLGNYGIGGGKTNTGGNGAGGALGMQGMQQQQQQQQQQSQSLQPSFNPNPNLTQTQSQNQNQNSNQNQYQQQNFQLQAVAAQLQERERSNMILQAQQRAQMGQGQGQGQGGNQMGQGQQGQGGQGQQGQGSMPSNGGQANAAQILSSYNRMQANGGLPGVGGGGGGGMSTATLQQQQQQQQLLAMHLANQGQAQQQQYGGNNANVNNNGGQFGTTINSAGQRNQGNNVQQPGGINNQQLAQQQQALMQNQQSLSAFAKQMKSDPTQMAGEMQRFLQNQSRNNPNQGQNQQRPGQSPQIGSGSLGNAQTQGTLPTNSLSQTFNQAQLRELANQQQLNRSPNNAALNRYSIAQAQMQLQASKQAAAAAAAGQQQGGGNHSGTANGQNPVGLGLQMPPNGQAVGNGMNSGNNNNNSRGQPQGASGNAAPGQGFGQTEPEASHLSHQILAMLAQQQQQQQQSGQAMNGTLIDRMDEQQKIQYRTLFEQSGRSQQTFQGITTPQPLQPQQFPQPQSSPNAPSNQAAAAAQHRAHLAQSQGQFQNQLQTSVSGNRGQQGGNGGGQAVSDQPEGPKPGLDVSGYSDENLLTVGRGMLNRLTSQKNAYEKDAQQWPPGTPERINKDMQINVIRSQMTLFMTEMSRRNLDTSLLFTRPDGSNGQIQASAPVQANVAAMRQAGLPLHSPSQATTFLPNNANNSSPMLPPARAASNDIAFQQQAGREGSQMTRRVSSMAGSQSGNSGFNNGPSDGIPPATTPLGLACQNCRAPPEDKFRRMLVEMLKQRGLTEKHAERMIENRVVNLYSLLCVVLRFGGSEEVRDKDIWSMVGGAMGFVNSPGPPKLSSADVAHQLSEHHENFLLDFETGWLTAIASNQPDISAGLQQQRSRLTDVIAARSGAFRTGNSPMSQQPDPIHPSPHQQQFGAIGSQPLAALRHQLPQLSGMPTADQLKSMTMTPEQMAAIMRQQQALQQQRGQLSDTSHLPQPASSGDGAVGLNNTQQNGNGAPAVPLGMSLDHAISAENWLKQNARSKSTIVFEPRNLAPQEKVNYKRILARGFQIVQNFDAVVRELFLANRNFLKNPAVLYGCNAAHPVRVAIDAIRGESYVNSAEGLKDWIISLVEGLKRVLASNASIAPSVQFTPLTQAAVLSISSQASQRPQNGPPPQPISGPSAEHAPSPAAGSGSGLRQDDLKPPPAKRQKSAASQAKDRSSPAAAPSPLGRVTSLTEPGHGRKASTGWAAAKKVSARKVTKQKVSGTGQTPVSSGETPKEIIDLEASPDQKPSPLPTPVRASEPRAPTTSVPPESVITLENALGIKFGEQAMQLRLQEEAKGRQDPLQYLGDSVARLQRVMARTGESQEAIERVLDFGGGFSLPHDWLASPTEGQRFEPTGAPAANEVVDYSLYIDDSMLGHDEAADLSAELSMITPTPGLEPASSMDPSPASEPSSPAFREAGLVGSPGHDSLDLGIYGDDGWFAESNHQPTWQWDLPAEKGGLGGAIVMSNQGGPRLREV